MVKEVSKHKKYKLTCCGKMALINVTSYHLHIVVNALMCELHFYVEGAYFFNYYINCLIVQSSTMHQM